MSQRQEHPRSKRHAAGEPTIRSATIRKEAKDGPSWTPTELHQRAKYMKQFCRMEGSGISQAYRDNYDLIDWGKK